MMELKNYQKLVLKDIDAYLDALMKTDGINAAWKEYWASKGIGAGFTSYYDDLGGAPNVCIKVPTGGGKTFLAASSVKTVFDRLPTGKTKFVVWLVPSDAILTQTVANLSNPNHPYRQRLNMDFGGCVNVYTKEQLLNAQNFKPTDVMENLSIAIFCYASIRANPKSKDDRKIYQGNGNLLGFAEMFNDRELLLADTPDTALLQVIRQMNPVVVVDESHNAKSELSIAMLKNLNPSFVLSMTATPTKRSNIISYVNARELKKENMVKLPVVVYNRPDRKSVIHDAVKLRGVLELKAQAESATNGSYVRPIVLFQAQPKTAEDSATFEKIKAKLVAMGIKAEEIAIKTADKDDLKTVDLMAANCPVRYIITVNALKEGWDCPFAYVLASLANKTSQVDVEQIVGRILRQPYARKHSEKLLNMSYVLACSADFQATVKSVVEGLNGAGFSANDYRVAEAKDMESAPSSEPVQATLDESSAVESGEQPTDNTDDDLSDVPDEKIDIPKQNDVEAQTKTDAAIGEIINTAETQSDDYEQKNKEAADDGLFNMGVPNVKIQRMQPEFAAEAAQLEIPQFMVQDDVGLFGGDESLVPLNETELLDGFTLAAKDAAVPFNLAVTGAVRVDISESGDVTPKCKQLTKPELEYFSAQLAAKTTDDRIKALLDMAATQLDGKIDFCQKKEIKDYIVRVAQQLPAAERNQLSLELLPSFVQCVRDKIDKLAKQHKKSTFTDKINQNVVVCKANYKLPQIIQPISAVTYIEKSLYTGEYDDMNPEELSVIQAVASKENVKWWHRIKDRKGFCINGFINHYPDFMVYTDKGNVVMVEYKGADRDGSDSQAKAELGRIWADNAGQKYKYFMVFLKDGDAVQGALKIDAFLNTIEKL
jgi:type III restriction enzyme